MRRAIAAALIGLLLAAAAGAQEPAEIRKPKVEAAPVDPVAVAPGGSKPVELNFRVLPGYHINSNKPNSELLIPTVLRLALPTNVSIAKVIYPPGRDQSFNFAPDEKLSVYAGDFTIAATVRASHSMTPGRYRVHGSLQYQACDDRACYPPAKVPVEFDVSIAKAASKRVRKNPGQSPHIRR